MPLLHYNDPSNYIHIIYLTIRYTSPNTIPDNVN